ncbi:XRE family transcriptional regulator [Pedobacter sp. MC2016-24]|uniref:XRE family transcriptional regulator n=1 Tax=Pedobacter sp. MC2016-24 TaxID=2780090 RepID=UPI001881DF2B|nr:XRE family transcriptional regulator [Pedobacter sp. MC2016-24]MBE9598020.1 XRE family transcriptional regulator [Pedobacter sp. MC2016-24]
MSTISGINILAQQLTPQQLDHLQKAADLHKTQSNIEFSVLKIEEGILQILVQQGERPSGNYASRSTLIKRAHEVFDKWMPAYLIQVEVEEFRPSITAVVNPAWLERMMEEKEVRIKQIAFDTGVDRESIAGWVSGKKNMSQIVKAMFYFYFTSILVED